MLPDGTLSDRIFFDQTGKPMAMFESERFSTNPMP